MTESGLTARNLSPKEIRSFTHRLALGDQPAPLRVEWTEAIRGRLRQDPNESELHFALAHAIYELWNPPIPPELAIEALEHLDAVDDMQGRHGMAGLYRAYLSYKLGALAHCVAACHAVSREDLANQGVDDWVLIARDEQEFVASVQLGIGGAHVRALFDNLLREGNQQLDADVFPFDVSLFIRFAPQALDSGLICDSDELQDLHHAVETLARRIERGDSALGMLDE